MLAGIISLDLDGKSESINIALELALVNTRRDVHLSVLLHTIARVARELETNVNR